VEGAVGVEVTTLGGCAAGGEHELVVAAKDDLVAFLDAAVDDNPATIREPKVRIESDDLVGDRAGR
jgi:hypothetical protein